MTKSIKTKAVIYFTPTELKSNLYKGTTSEQLAKCYDYCKQKDYEVVKVFSDESILPYAFDEVVFNEMLDYIDTQPIGSSVVIFNDLTNFENDYRELLKLRLSIFHQRGTGVECLNFKFKSTPQSRLVENILDLLTDLSVL